jgi:hypothetical protein
MVICVTSSKKLNGGEKKLGETCPKRNTRFFPPHRVLLTTPRSHSTVEEEEILKGTSLSFCSVVWFSKRSGDLEDLKTLNSSSSRIAFIYEHNPLGTDNNSKSIPHWFNVIELE